MASRTIPSPLSSPAPSPPASPLATPIQQYDPFSDAVELASLSSPSGYADNVNERSRRSQSRSPVDTLHPLSYFATSQSRGRYAPLGHRESPQQTVQSGRESVYTVSSLYQSKTVDADTQALVDRRAGEVAKWKIHWITPTLMILLYLAGIVAAVAHHFFYASLNGQPAKEQLKMVRYGTALAFFVKSTLVGTTIMCNRQRIWRTFRTRAMTINGIDGLFSATEDPTQFFLNWEMIRNGKLATLMAISSWLIPIASVLSPASLTTELSQRNMTAICPAVANLKFSHESTYDYRQRNPDDWRVSSLMFINTTDLLGKTKGYFDYYDQPSKMARRLAYSAAYLKKPLPRENARINFCGFAFNCTYSLNFLGPGYKCEDMTNSTTSVAPFSVDKLAPEGNFTYFAEVFQNEYANPQIDSLNGVPVQPPPYPDSLGVFESEPNLWIGYSIKKNESYPSDSPYAKKWDNVHESRILKCVMYHTNYTFKMEYRPLQNATLLQRDFLSPVINTTLQPSDSDPTQLTAIPSSNFIRPGDDPERYKLFAVYHAMGALLRNFLAGNIERNSQKNIITRSDISETRLISLTTAYPVPNFMESVQSMFEDMLITLLSESSLVVADKQDVPCQKFQNIVQFRYYKRGLWIGYAAVISITLVFLFVGAWSIYQNGVSSDVLFSRIMATTRNPTLDQLCVGACLGGDPFPKELTKTKLRFGVLLEEDPRDGPIGVVEHCCFGTVGETKEVIKGGNYAGLRTRRREGAEQSEVRKEGEHLLAFSEKKLI